MNMIRGGSRGASRGPRPPSRHLFFFIIGLLKHYFVTSNN